MEEDPTELDQSAVPCPREDVKVADMPLSAVEGYVFSRMDGVMSVAELLSACSLDDEEGARILGKLVELGAIDILSAVEDYGEAKPAEDGGKPGLGEGKDVTEKLKERIVEMRKLSEEGTFYEFLGVSPDSEKAAIRKAYFDLSKEFHPDAYYGKDLGKYRPQMETIFGRLTDAYETLSKAKKRARYDEYIAEQIKAWEMEKRLAQVPALVLYRPKAAPPPEEGAEGAAAAAEAPAAGRGPASPTPSPATPRPAAAHLSPESAIHRRLKEQRKKRALDALLKATGAGPTKKRREAEDEARPAFVPQTAEQKLAVQYAVAGADALDRKEFMTALNYFELALQITPDDREVAELVNRVRDEAGAALSETYEKQGAYEEELGQHVKAAQSFLKALDVRKRDHLLMERAAVNLLWGGGNLKRAEELAKNALEFEPNNVDYRATLGEILLKKGDISGAHRLLRDTARLDPNNERVARLLEGGGSR